VPARPLAGRWRIAGQVPSVNSPNPFLRRQNLGFFYSRPVGCRISLDASTLGGWINQQNRVLSIKNALYSNVFAKFDNKFLKLCVDGCGRVLPFL
jgi:hypothetical protein